MKQELISKQTGISKYNLSGPGAHSDASKLVNHFEAMLQPFYSLRDLPHEMRMTILDKCMMNWVKSQRYLLYKDSPQFREYLIQQGYLKHEHES